MNFLEIFLKLKENYLFFHISKYCKILWNFDKINLEAIEVTIIHSPSNLFSIIPSRLSKITTKLPKIENLVLRILVKFLFQREKSSMDGLHMYMYNTRVSYSLPLRLFHSAISHSERFLSRKEERNLPPFFFEEALPRNLTWMQCHLSIVQVQSNLRENRCTCTRQTPDSLRQHFRTRIRYYHRIEMFNVIFRLTNFLNFLKI